MSNTAQLSRFTRVGAKRETELEQFPIVTDGRTNLMWDRRETAKLSEQEAEAHIAKLNREKFGGFDDWRQPTHDELRTLVDLSTHEPCTDSEAFPDCKHDWYRTSTPCAWSPDGPAWFVHFDNGGSGVARRGYGGFLRACRPS